jgi:dynein heavy chain
VLHLQERPDLANLKSALVVSNAKMKAELAALEGRILGLLSASSGNILEDEELINTLAQAKVRRHSSSSGSSVSLLKMPTDWLLVNCV